MGFLLLLEILVSSLVLISATFILIGSVGLLKFNRLPVSLHPVGLSSTVGITGSILGSTIYFTHYDQLTLHELLIGLFSMISMPVVSLFIAKIYMFQNRRELPIPDSTNWVTANTFQKPKDKVKSKAEESDVARMD